MVNGLISLRQEIVLYAISLLRKKTECDIPVGQKWLKRFTVAIIIFFAIISLCSHLHATLSHSCPILTLTFIPQF